LDDLLQKRGLALARALLTLLSKVQRIEDIRYILTLVHDLISKNPGAAQFFHQLQAEKPKEGIPELPFGPFLMLLDRRGDDDPYVLSKASSVVALFLSNFPNVKHGNLERTVQWFVKKLEEQGDAGDVARLAKDAGAAERDHRARSKVLANLREVLKKNDYRLVFAKERGLEPLFELSRYDPKHVNGRKIELLYSALYCIWLLSFHPSVRKTMTVPALISNLCLLLRTCLEKDKVVRMSLAILRNLLHIHRNNQLMISFSLDRLIQQIKAKQSIMSDKDVIDDVEELETALAKVVDELSSFDVYHSEVHGRNLEWTSPTHKSEKFWTENCLKIEDSNLLSTLKDILENEQNTDVLCVACWDIGEFVRFHPHGKSIVNNLDIKVPIMKLLSHSDAGVRNHALLTLQKVMITNWEYLQA